MNLILEAEKYKEAFLEIQELVISQVGYQKVSVTLGDHYRLNNTPLYLALEFHILEKESDEDQGLCLSVSYHRYNPVLRQPTVSMDELFTGADLSTANGNTISCFDLIKINVTDPLLDIQLKNIRKQITLFLKGQISEIVATISSY